MEFPFYQVDAFANAPFEGNPAAVVVLPEFPADNVLRSIAAENNLAETAFLVADISGFRLRWFTPVVEVPLCGHATLASAAVVMERLEPETTQIVFNTLSGELPVRKSADSYVLNFPSRPSKNVPSFSEISHALKCEPLAVYENEFNYMAVLESPQAVRDCQPDLPAIALLDRPGVIVTAKGDGDWDFVSRYFAPKKGIPEDPVTGAAHCMLAPYWATILGKTDFRAFQASRRGAEVVCRLRGDRVELEGRCMFVIEGRMTI